MGNDNQTLKRLTPVVFLIATLLLVVGVFLSLIIPAKAQTGMGTGTPTVGAGANATAVVPVTGTTNTDDVVTNTLNGWSVVDRDGMQVGTVNGLVLDLRRANLCVKEAASATAAPTAAATSAAGMSSSESIATCKLTRGESGETAGVVSFVLVDRSGVAAGGSSSTATPAATAVMGRPTAAATSAMSATQAATSAAVSATAPVVNATPVPVTGMGGTLVPVPWRLVRFDLVNHVVIIDVKGAVLVNAPSFTADNLPDLFVAPTSTKVTQFWTNPNAVIPNTGGAAQATSAPTAVVPAATTQAPTVAATTAPVSPTTAATVVPTTASSGISSSAAVTSTAPATVAAPVSTGTPSALVPVTGEDLAQAHDAAVAQQRVILDVGIVVVGLGLLVIGLLFRGGKG